MASQSRFFKFFESAKGRRFTFYSTVVASMGAFCVNFIPNTFGVSKYREIIASYREGTERPVPENIRKRYEIAQELLEVNDFESNFMMPFMVSGFDLHHIGSSKFRYGALTGIPINFTYTVPADIDKADIIIRGKPIDWNSQGGKLLEESLVLKEDEQIFGITREMRQLQTNQVFLDSLYSTGTIAAYYIFTSTVNNKMNLFYRPLSLRIFLYTIAGFFCFGVYAFITDYSQVQYDIASDEKLASFGKGFIEAGYRFYDKLLKKNIAIRELTGDNSEYTALGNENFYLRQKRLPLTMRKTFFQQKLEELKKKEGESVEEEIKTEESLKE